MMGPERSSEESSRVMAFLMPFLELFVGKGNVTEYLVRKLAHFCEFALLGMELSLFFLAKETERNGQPVLLLQRKQKRPYLLAVSHALFAALTDETIQIFSSRGSQVQDVWLDVSGAVCGAIGIYILFQIIFKVRKTPEE